MRKLFVILFLTIAVSICSADASLLPTGTTIIYPDGTRTVLVNDQFLLDRTALQSCVQAMNDVATWEAAANAEKSVALGLQKKLDNAKVWEDIIIVGAVALGVTGFFLGRASH